MKIPDSPHCGQPLTRINKVTIERFIADEDIYRDINAMEGIAAEGDLCCGHCDEKLPREYRAHFYKHWYLTRQFNVETP